MRPVGEYEEGAPEPADDRPGRLLDLVTDSLRRLLHALPHSRAPRRLRGGNCGVDREDLPRRRRGPQRRPCGRRREDGNRHQPNPLGSAARVGRRAPRSASRSATAQSFEIELEPIFRFHMMGIGYQHPEWGHAVWRDELEIGYESWKLDEVEADEYCTHPRTQRRARDDGRADRASEFSRRSCLVGMSRAGSRTCSTAPRKTGLRAITELGATLSRVKTRNPRLRPEDRDVARVERVTKHVDLQREGDERTATDALHVAAAEKQVAVVGAIRS